MKQKKKFRQKIKIYSVKYFNNVFIFHRENYLLRAHENCKINIF